jgi:L-rhamnose mutarotase
VTERVAFVLTVKPDRVDEYVQAHAAVWPEMLAALTEAGYRNYTIFRDGNRMFGYVETDDATASAAAMERSPVNARWQDTMAELLEERVADAGPAKLEEVFRLD